MVVFLGVSPDNSAEVAGKEDAENAPDAVRCHLPIPNRVSVDVLNVHEVSIDIPRRQGIEQDLHDNDEEGDGGHDEVSINLEAFLKGLLVVVFQRDQVRHSWDSSHDCSDETHEEELVDAVFSHVLNLSETEENPPQELDDATNTNDVGANIDWDAAATVVDVTFEHVFVSFVMHILLKIILCQLNCFQVYVNIYNAQKRA